MLQAAFILTFFIAARTGNLTSWNFGARTVLHMCINYGRGKLIQ